MVIDQGEEEMNVQESMIVEDGVIYYTYEDWSDGYHCGVRKLEDDKTVTVAEYDNIDGIGLMKVENGICYISMLGETRAWNTLQSMGRRSCGRKRLM